MVAPRDRIVGEAEGLAVGIVEDQNAVPAVLTYDGELLVELSEERRAITRGRLDSYLPGDRISHPKLGEGVVQRALGPKKVEVRFGDESRVLVQGRG